MDIVRKKIWNDNDKCEVDILWCNDCEHHARSCTCCKVPGETDVQPIRHPKWEYCVEIFSVQPGGDPYFRESLNRLGAEGWELVGNSPFELNRFIFKRRK